MATDDQIDEWITLINERGVNLTQWEQEFMAAVTEQWDRRPVLSDRQVEIIERIYTERVS